MSTLYPIIRRVRRALLPPEEKAPGTALTVCGPSSPQPSPPGEGEASPVVVESAATVAPVEVVVVETSQVVTVAQSPSLPGESQSLLTSAAMGKKATPHPGPLPDRGGEGGDDQSLLTSAATKATKGKREAAKARVKAINEAHPAQP